MKKIMDKVDLLPLSQFTLAQKLNLMEAIWDELSRDEEHLESPAWHDEVLKDREKAIDSGNASISDWENSKDRIRKNVS